MHCSLRMGVCNVPPGGHCVLKRMVIQITIAQGGKEIVIALLALACWDFRIIALLLVPGTKIPFCRNVTDLVCCLVLNFRSPYPHQQQAIILRSICKKSVGATVQGVYIPPCTFALVCTTISAILQFALACTTCTKHIKY